MNKEHEYKRFHVMLINGQARAMRCKNDVRERRGYARTRLAYRVPVLVWGLPEAEANGWARGYNAAVSK